MKKLQKRLKKREAELDKVLTEQEKSKDVPPNYKVSKLKQHKRQIGLSLSNIMTKSKTQQN